jgi:hypothetical protein
MRPASAERPVEAGPERMNERDCNELAAGTRRALVGLQALAR